MSEVVLSLDDEGLRVLHLALNEAMSMRAKRISEFYSTALSPQSWPMIEEYHRLQDIDNAIPKVS